MNTPETLEARLRKHIAGIAAHEERLTPVLDLLLHDLMGAADALASLRAENERLSELLERVDTALRAHPGPNGTTHFECWVRGCHERFTRALEESDV